MPPSLNPLLPLLELVENIECRFIVSFLSLRGVAAPWLLVVGDDDDDWPALGCIDGRLSDQLFVNKCFPSQLLALEEAGFIIQADGG